MQMNLCLSGIGGCYSRVDYPAGVQEAIARIRGARPDAVTVNEACRGDIALIARRTGYHTRFSEVIYQGKLLPCIDPGGRGLFGDAVLTKSPILSSKGAAFATQAGPEQRKWLCVRTRRGVEVCTTHLASAEAVEDRANGPQCAELRAVLAEQATRRAVIFGGDVNRLSPCAPRGFWVESDSSAEQAPGIQQVYGTRAFRSPSVTVLPATHTDHDFLLVRTTPTAQR